ncbi:UNVERIFIED_CONTAM: hypothetical protein Sangu_2475100 [Sesamum angustifolium]|uniref:Uncharacterized protein n=1 Tax=Sesamum angustifolium TaxID=2727405 RepID=A0AAW2IP11_9LAMI
MPERDTVSTQAPKYVPLCFFPDHAESFPDARVRHEKFGYCREISLTIFANGECRPQGAVKP